MSKLLKALTLIALLGCAAAAYADPPGRVARLNLVSGRVSFAPGEAPDEWVQAPVNRPLTSGDRLWADNGGRAEGHVGSVALRLAPPTSGDGVHLRDRTFHKPPAPRPLNPRGREIEPGGPPGGATPRGAGPRPPP